MAESTSTEAAAGNVRVVYILYLVSLVVGVTSIIGVIMAYVYKDAAPESLYSHYRFLIRTFWIGLLYVLVGMALAVVAIGYLIILFWVVWLIVRCVKGLQYLERGEPHPDPGTWMFG
jgi:uncharacterized membrane protein